MPKLLLVEVLPGPALAQLPKGVEADTVSTAVRASDTPPAPDMKQPAPASRLGDASPKADEEHLHSHVSDLGADTVVPCAADSLAVMSSMPSVGSSDAAAFSKASAGDAAAGLSPRGEERALGVPRVIPPSPQEDDTPFPMPPRLVHATASVTVAPSFAKQDRLPPRLRAGLLVTDQLGNALPNRLSALLTPVPASMASTVQVTSPRGFAGGGVVASMDLIGLSDAQYARQHVTRLSAVQSPRPAPQSPARLSPSSMAVGHVTFQGVRCEEAYGLYKERSAPPALLFGASSMSPAQPFRELVRPLPVSQRSGGAVLPPSQSAAWGQAAWCPPASPHGSPSYVFGLTSPRPVHY